MATKPKKKYTSKLKALEEMYGKDVGFKTLKTDKEIREYFKGKENRGLRGFIMGHD